LSVFQGIPSLLPYARRLRGEYLFWAYCPDTCCFSCV